MAETFITLPSDAANTGKPVANFIDSLGYYRQVTIWGDSSSSGAIVAAVKAASVSPVTAVDGAGVVVLRPDSTVSVTGSVAVTGTFFQSTQPVSLASSVAVTGTFWQATQPVSISSTITLPVSGTFWQSTQPVSIASAVTIAGGNKPVGPASINAVQSAPIGTSAVLVIAARTGGVGTGRCTVTLKNISGGAIVYLGQSAGVTTSTGYPLSPGDSVSFDTAAAIYGISTAAGNVIAVMETF